ncbi:hypothetical protein [Priestia megaterium]
MNKGLKLLMVIIGCVLFGALIRHIRDSYSISTALLAIVIFAVIYKIVETLIKKKNNDSSM